MTPGNLNGVAPADSAAKRSPGSMAIKMHQFNDELELSPA